jgi:dolichol-phosphate mannosyltransferase
MRSVTLLRRRASIIFVEPIMPLEEQQKPTAADALDTSGWEVPDYQTHEFAARSSDYCVVIPVINEGQKIGRLLDRMQRLGIAKMADILIVDAGSTDGSLEHASLTAREVRALLVKLGPGKLSAQLRCAYAYALTQGYQGIVTIDGNDKDDPEAIPRLIGELRSGVDFVQASRFIPGGVAENTPASRLFAIRWLHAPLLSLASGFHWTDTTQGFRGYSKRLLVDQRVRPFRSIFSTYELLAYLSYRAPRLGFVCKESPSTRRYPPTGKVPTKISPLRGNWTVLRILLAACLGRYNP